jgi:hypothetical protein
MKFKMPHRNSDLHAIRCIFKARTLDMLLVCDNSHDIDDHLIYISQLPSSVIADSSTLATSSRQD